MAKKIKLKSEPQPSKHIKTHVAQLGFSDFDKYFQWCKENGFAMSWNKHLKDIRQEEEFYNQLLKEKAFYLAIDRNPRKH